MNVLITSASRKVWLVRAFQHALAELGGGQVVAVDANPAAAALHLADRSLILPVMEPDDYVDSVLSLCARYDIRLVVPTRDEELPIFARAREAAQHQGVMIMVGSPAMVSTCQDKRRFLDFCLAHGFAVPEVLDDAQPYEFPMFVRDRFGKGSRRAFRVDSAEDLVYARRVLKEPVIQRYVTAPEYTVDVFADFDGRVLSVVPRERLLVVAGESYVGRTRKHPAVIREAERLSVALALVGHNTIQCFAEVERVSFIEVNPRYGGGASLGFAAGGCSPRELLRRVRGEAVSPRMGEFKDGLMMLRYTEDLFIAEREVSGLATYPRSAF